jgi:hypothetical protein
MSSNRPPDEETLAELLRQLPPAPEGWVRAAQELMQTRRELDQILALAEADASFRRELIADLEAALDQAGWEPAPRLVCELRARLGDETERP